MKVLLANNCGLGDYILMNGATRYIAAQEDVEHVDLLCIAEHNKYMNIKRMYQDEPKITVHGEPIVHCFPSLRKKIRKLSRKFPDSDKRVFCWESRRWPQAMIGCGLDPEKDCWNELFYAAHRAPYSARHEHFYVERDRQREAKLFKELELPLEYALCVDQGRLPKYNLNPKTNLTVFKPHYRQDLFHKYHIWDWMTVIERAKEVYTVDTGWLHFLKSMRLEQPKYYYHVRGNWLKNVFTSRYINDEYDNGWQIIDRNGDFYSDTKFQNYSKNS
jgi:hypothetical protein